MKKLLLAVFLPLLVFSCALIDDNTTIYNNSSYPVTFEFINVNTGKHTIGSGKTETYYSHGASIKFSHDSGRVSYKKIEDYKGEFFDTVPLPLNINNTLSVSIILSEKNGCMDNDISINANETKIDGEIYTSNPTFISTPSAKISYFVDSNMMYVTVY